MSQAMYPPCLVTVVDVEDTDVEGVKQFTRYTNAAKEPSVHFLTDISESTVGKDELRVFIGKELDGVGGFLEHIKSLAPKDILFFVHGYSNTPHFPVVHVYQRLRAQLPDSVVIIPVVWPSNDTRENIPLWAYYTDQGIVENVAPALAKVFCDLFENFKPDATKIHLMCHSMGNRVLRITARHLNEVVYKDKQAPRMVENIFMVAADVTGNIFHSLGNSDQIREDGQAISQMAKNIEVLYATNDDMLWYSNFANFFQPRLGRTGPKPSGGSGWFGRGLVPKLPSNVTGYDATAWSKFPEMMNGHNYVYEKETVAIILKRLLET